MCIVGVRGSTGARSLGPAVRKELEGVIWAVTQLGYIQGSATCTQP